MIRKVGKVFLVGAGPGDPGLITVRGLECPHRALPAVAATFETWTAGAVTSLLQLRSLLEKKASAPMPLDPALSDEGHKAPLYGADIVRLRKRQNLFQIALVEVANR